MKTLNFFSTMDAASPTATDEIRKKEEKYPAKKLISTIFC